MKEDITDLIDKFNKGEASGYKGIFDYYYDDIFYFARKMIGNTEDAEDIASQIFIKLFERHQHFETAPNIKAFLFISTRNLSLNYLRDRQYKNEFQQQFVQKMEDDYRLSLEHEVKPDILEAVQNGISKLPGTCRKIFRMLYFQDLKPAEVAHLLGISVDNVYNQKKRALQILRLELNDNQFAIILALYLIAAQA